MSPLFAPPRHHWPASPTLPKLQSETRLSLSIGPQRFTANASSSPTARHVDTSHGRTLDQALLAVQGGQLFSITRPGPFPPLPIRRGGKDVGRFLHLFPTAADPPPARRIPLAPVPVLKGSPRPTWRCPLPTIAACGVLASLHRPRYRLLNSQGSVRASVHQHGAAVAALAAHSRPVSMSFW